MLRRDARRSRCRVERNAMMRLLSSIIISLLCATAAASAAEPQLVVDLWPAKAADDVGIPGEEHFFDLILRGKPHTIAGQSTKWLTDVSRPQMVVYRAP